MRGGAGWYLGLTQRAFQGQSAESTSAIIERANKIWRHGITMRATRLRTDEDAPRFKLDQGSHRSSFSRDPFYRSFVNQF